MIDFKADFVQSIQTYDPNKIFPVKIRKGTLMMFSDATIVIHYILHIIIHSERILYFQRFKRQFNEPTLNMTSENKVYEGCRKKTVSFET